MRVLRFSLSGLILLLLLVFLPGPARGANSYSISGRLLFTNGGSPCDPCNIELTIAGVQRVASAYTDTGGNFRFDNVMPGSYVIHVELKGYEDVNESVDVMARGGITSMLTIMMTRKGNDAVQSDQNSGIIDVSQFLQAYPKKAVDAYNKGVEKRKKGKNEEAIRYFEQAVDIAPNFYNAHNDLGVAYKEAGRMDDAEREFLRANELNPSGVDPLINLTSLYIDQNKPERAVATGEQAVKANSTSASAFLNLGIALYKFAMLDRAEAALKKALDLAPKLFQARLMLANVYMKEQRYDSLMEQLDHYLAENPKGQQRAAVERMRRQLLEARQASKP